MISTRQSRTPLLLIAIVLLVALASIAGQASFSAAAATNLPDAAATRAHLSAAPSAAHVHPVTGVDTAAFNCSQASPCRTVAYALSLSTFDAILLAPLSYNESTITLSSLGISIAGFGGTAVFDCALRRPSPPPAPAFLVAASNASFSNIAIRNCGGDGVFGGAIGATYSSLNIANCTFTGNAATSGGAVALSGGQLVVTGSVFINNSATCNTTNCSSAWGGAVMAYNADNVVVTSSIFESNSALLSSAAGFAVGPMSVGTFAVGGGCIAVTYNQSSLASKVSISGNTLLQCSAQISSAPAALFSGFFSGAFGGAVSIYYGLNPSAASSVAVTQATTQFINNTCSLCIASIAISSSDSAHTASAQGGCVSLYTGGFGTNPGNTIISNSLFVANQNIITSCSASAHSRTGAVSFGGGISFSFGSVDTNACVACVAGTLSVRSSRFVASGNTVSDCIVTAAVDINRPKAFFVFGPSAAGAGISIFAANTFLYQTLISTGDIMGDASIAQSIANADGNTVRNCRAQAVLSGLREEPALASFIFGGGISVLFGVVALASG